VRRRGAAAAVALVLGVGCSKDPAVAPVVDAGPDGGADPEGSLRKGSRLVPRLYTTSDGLTSYRGMFDTKLGVPCYPSKFLDGSDRCEPSLTSNHGDLSYSDAACSRPAVPKQVVSFPSCDVPKFVFVSDAKASEDPCEPPRHSLFRILGEVTAATAYTKTGDACTATTGAAQDLVELEPMAATEVVKLTPAVDSFASGLGIDVFVGDDGSRFPTSSLSDRKRGDAQCFPQRAADGQLRCLPYSAIAEAGFLDQGCTIPAFGAMQCAPSSADASLIVRSIPEKAAGCEPLRHAVHQRGAKRAGRATYSGTTGACVGPQDWSDGDLFDLGPEVESASFPALEELELGGTRIVQFTRGVSRSAMIGQGTTLFDRTTDVECEFTIAADGKLRCLAGRRLHYSDPECRTMIIAEFGACEKVPKYGTTAEETCPPKTHVFAAGAKLPDKTKTFFKHSGGCSEQSGLATAAYAVGPEVAPETFAEGVLTPE
jgi:hypothetical protein